MANALDIQGTDLLFDGDFEPDGEGGLALISGIENLKQRLLSRLMTVPGTWVTRPTFGVGVKLYQNNISSFAKQQALANLIQEQFSEDIGVQDVSSIAINANDSHPDLTVIVVGIIPVGYTDAVQMTFIPFGGGGSF